MNVELAEQVRDKIISDPSSHDQITWSCGTTACIAGHAIYLGSPESEFVAFDSQQMVMTPGNPLITPFRVAQDLLGLTHEEAFSVFFETNEERAIEKLEHLIKDHASDRKV